DILGGGGPGLLLRLAVVVAGQLRDRGAEDFGQNRRVGRQERPQRQFGMRLRTHRASLFLPSPLVGEGGRERSERPGEGEPIKAPSPASRLRRSAPSPTRGEGFRVRLAVIARSPISPSPPPLAREVDACSASGGGIYRFPREQCAPSPTLPSLRGKKQARSRGTSPRSSRDLPGGAILGILQHDPHSGEFVADAIGLLEVLSLARGIARVDQAGHLTFVDRGRSAAPRLPVGGGALQYADQLRAGFETGRRRLCALERLGAQLVQRGQRLRCVEIVRQGIERVGAKIAGRGIGGQIVPAV